MKKIIFQFQKSFTYTPFRFASIPSSLDELKSIESDDKEKVPKKSFYI